MVENSQSRSPRTKTIFAIISEAMSYNYFISLPISTKVHYMTHTIHSNISQGHLFRKI